MNNFSKTLRASRETLGVSLRSVARAAEMDPTYLSRLETGKTAAPRPETVEKLATALCRQTGVDDELCQHIRRELMESAGHLLSQDRVFEDLEDRFAARLRATGQMNESQILEALSKVPLPEMRRVLSGSEPLEVRLVEDLSSAEVAKRKRAGEPVYVVSPPSGHGSEELRVGEQKMIQGSLMPTDTDEDSALAYLERRGREFQRPSDRPGPMKPRLKRAKLPKPFAHSNRINAGKRARIFISGKITAEQREQLEAAAKLIDSLLRDTE